jgi:hypothetical protein
VKKTRGVTESDAFLLCSFSLLSQRKRTKERATYHLVPLCGTTLRCSILPGVKKLAEFMPRRGAQTGQTPVSIVSVVLSSVKW